MITNSNHNTVMTLDAGGTNFVFSAFSNARELARPVAMPANGHNLDLCLKTLIRGFETIREQLQEAPQAISFAFPGPADYKNGVIGDLENLPAFRGGVALGPMLSEHFGVPVFINNDGDLFAYGEAMFGMLPELNRKISERGGSRTFNNLIGVTLGTGFGGGLVRNNQLFLGDNGAAAEVWLLRSPLLKGSFAEENISARAIVREYAAACGFSRSKLTPHDIFNIATGQTEGNRGAALESFRFFGRALGASLAEIVTILDAPVVIGGGLSNAWPLFFPEMLEQLNGGLHGYNGNSVKRLVMEVLNLEDEKTYDIFKESKATKVKVPFSEKTAYYEPVKQIGVGLSRLGASKAIALGAYAFAINAIERFNENPPVYEAPGGV
jgi:glucokinase